VILAVELRTQFVVQVLEPVGLRRKHLDVVCVKVDHASVISCFHRVHVDDLKLLTAGTFWVLNEPVRVNAHDYFVPDVVRVVFFAGAFLAVAFFAGAFLAVAFFAGAFLAAAFGVTGATSGAELPALAAIFGAVRAADAAALAAVLAVAAALFAPTVAAFTAEPAAPTA
jgi:hypothetical protein